MKFITVVFTALVASAVAEYRSYEGYKVYQVTPKTEDHLNILKGFEQNKEQIDFWTTTHSLNKTVDVMVELKAQRKFTTTLSKHGINYETKIFNLETAIKAHRLLQEITPKLSSGDMNFDKYHRYEDIQAYLLQLNKTYPNIAQLESIGKSYEGRPLYVLKISTGGTGKPTIFVDAGIHAREWIAPSTAIYLIQELVENPAKKYLIEKIDWHIIPLLNPDGYEYSHTNDRLWRKTVTPYKLCNGADGNRNFDYHWMETGASNNECDPAYAGPNPFSESETRALRDYLIANSNTIKLYISLHSYGEYILYPWGYTFDRPADERELRNLAKQVLYEIRSYRGTDYVVGTSSSVVYPAAGGSHDWVKGVAGIELSYTIELPGENFQPPAEEIKKVGEETFLGIVAFHDYILEKFVKE